MRVSRCLSALSIALSLFVAIQSRSADAALVIFSASDAGAGSASPRPNSSAAASAFDAGAALLGSVNVIDFESAPVGTFINLLAAPGVTITGTDVLGGPQSIRDTADGSPDSIYGYNTTSGGSHFLYEHGNVVTFHFATGVSAFGAYISGIQFSGETITFDDGTSQTVSIPGLGTSDGGIAFVGFTDAGKLITSISINATGTGGPDFLGIDDVRFVSAAAPVPEPSTFILVGTLMLAGLTVSSAHRRRTA